MSKKIKIDWWPKIIPVIILVFGVCIWWIDSIDIFNKLSLIVLLGTALIYALQFINMHHVSINQEKILSQQRDIANKQYDFNVFTLRMNLRNELVKHFTLALSAEDVSITDDVNIHLVNIGKICDDIKFAFPQTKELTMAISQFKKSCKTITYLAPEKQLIIECSLTNRENSMIMKYKDCLQVVLENNKVTKSVINKELAKNLGFSQKQQTIILGIMQKYIGVALTKDDLENYVFMLFQQEMRLGNTRLNKVCDILDPYIKL